MQLSRYCGKQGIKAFFFQQAYQGDDGQTEQGVVILAFKCLEQGNSGRFHLETAGAVQGLVELDIGTYFFVA